MTDNDTTPPAAGPVAPAKSPRSRRWLTPVLGVIAALVIGGFGGILIGHATGGSSSQAGQTQRAGGGAAAGGAGGRTGGGFGGGAAGGGFTAGTVVSVSGDTVTLKASDGSTVKVTTSSSTKVTESGASTVSALKAGETVTVVGTKDASGNVTATSVSEGTQTFRGGAPGAAAKG
jgi:hypothetical protein